MTKKLKTIISSLLILSIIFGLTYNNTKEINPVYAQSKTNNTQKQVISLTPNNSLFLANGNVLETTICPVYFNNSIYVPLSLTLTELGYDVDYKSKKINIKNDIEDYTIDVGRKRVTDNNLKESIINVNFLTLNDYTFISLKDLTAIFPIYEYTKKNVTSLSLVNDKNIFEEVTNQYENLSIPQFKSFNTKENFDKYLNYLDYMYTDDYRYGYFANDMVVAEVEIGFAESESMASNSDTASIGTPTSSNNDFSQTVKQYDDVDEGDIIKTDGNYIYYAHSSYYYGSRNVLDIISTNDKGVNKITATIPLDNSNIQDIYVNNNNLIILGNLNESYSYTKKYNTPENILEIFDGMQPNYVTQTFAIQYDITDKSNPKLVRDTAFYGNYTNSRLINDTLYVYTNQYNYNNIEDALPKYKNNINNKTQAIPYENIYYNSSNLNNATMLNIFSFDLQKPQKDINAYSYLTNASQFNVNNTNMYIFNAHNYNSMPIPLYLHTNNIEKLNKTLSENRYYPSYTNEKSYIYKFALNDGKIAHTGTGAVKGYISSQYNMDEHNGYFRVATNGYDYTIDKRTNKLYVFDENMKQTGIIDSFAENENMHAVRFMGDKAYVVTFRNVDPLFAIDLKDPTNPKILGELKIPGFSEFMLPIDENHLIGIGQDTEVTKDDRFIITGMKMSLFDVSDMLNPKEKFVVKIGERGTYSEALHNPKSILYNAERGLFGFPINYVENNYKDQFNGATVYQVDVNKGFEHLGFVTQEPNTKTTTNQSSSSSNQTDILPREESYNYNIERIIQIKNNLYTASEAKIQANSLNTFDKLSEINFQTSEK